MSKIRLLIIGCLSYVSNGDYLVFQFFAICGLMAKTHILPPTSVLKIKEDIFGMGLYKIVSFTAKKVGYSGRLPGPKSLTFGAGTGSAAIAANLASRTERKADLKGEHDMLIGQCKVLGPEHKDFSSKFQRAEEISAKYPETKGVFSESAYKAKSVVAEHVSEICWWL
jgi:hypothetical protein